MLIVLFLFIGLTHQNITDVAIAVADPGAGKVHWLAID